MDFNQTKEIESLIEFNKVEFKKIENDFKKRNRNLVLIWTFAILFDAISLFSNILSNYKGGILINIFTLILCIVTAKFYFKSKNNFQSIKLSYQQTIEQLEKAKIK